MAVAKKIEHVAIAVNDVRAARETFRRNFGFPDVPTDAITALEAGAADLAIGSAVLSLFTPTNSASGAADFLKERGEGMYRVTLQVDDLSAMAARLAAKAIVVGATTLPDGTKVADLGPDHTHGVVLRLVERPARK